MDNNVHIKYAYLSLLLDKDKTIFKLYWPILINYFQRQFHADASNWKWLMDITEFKFYIGWKLTRYNDPYLHFRDTQKKILRQLQAEYERNR